MNFYDYSSQEQSVSFQLQDQNIVANTTQTTISFPNKIMNDFLSNQQTNTLLTNA